MTHCWGNLVRREGSGKRKDFKGIDNYSWWNHGKISFPSFITPDGTTVPKGIWQVSLCLNHLKTGTGFSERC